MINWMIVSMMMVGLLQSHKRSVVAARMRALNIKMK